MKTILAIVGSLILPALAQGFAKIPVDLAKAVAAYDSAQINSDVAELQRLLAEDYTLLNSAGKIESKSQFIAESTAPRFKLLPYTVREPIEKVWADGAVMAGLVTLRGTDGDKPFEVSLRFSDVWVKRRGVWKVIYTHASRQT